MSNLDVVIINFAFPGLWSTTLGPFLIAPRYPNATMSIWVSGFVYGFISRWNHGPFVTFQHAQQLFHDIWVNLRNIVVFAWIFFDVEEAWLFSALCRLDRGLPRAIDYCIL